MVDILPPDPQIEVMKHELINRYLELNSEVSELHTLLTRKRVQKDILNRSNRAIKTKLIDLVGIATVYDTHFFKDIKEYYQKFCRLSVDAATPKKAMYNAESTVQMWEITKAVLIEHSMIQLKGE